jgi:hypothetical protein
VPLDAVIGECAGKRGITIIAKAPEKAFAELRRVQFDFVLMSNVLHLAARPAALVTGTVSLLSRDGVLCVITPNFGYLYLKMIQSLWRKGRCDREADEGARVHVLTRRRLAAICRPCGAVVSQPITSGSHPQASWSALNVPFVDRLRSRETLMLVRKSPTWRGDDCRNLTAAAPRWRDR